MLTPRQIFGLFPGSPTSCEYVGPRVTVQFLLLQPNACSYYIEMRVRQFCVREGIHQRPDVVVAMTGDDFCALATDPVVLETEEAFDQGRLMLAGRVEDIGCLFKLANWAPPPPAPPLPAVVELLMMSLGTLGLHVSDVLGLDTAEDSQVSGTPHRSFDDIAGITPADLFPEVSGKLLFHLEGVVQLDLIGASGGRWYAETKQVAYSGHVDERLTIDPGVCPRPAGVVRMPADRFVGLVMGAIQFADAMASDGDESVWTEDAVRVIAALEVSFRRP